MKSQIYLFIILFTSSTLLTLTNGEQNPEIRGEVRGPIETQHASLGFEKLLDSAKSFVKKIQGYLGIKDAQSFLDRIGQVTTFYYAVRDNPEKVLENIKEALAKTLNQTSLSPNATQQLADEAAALQKLLKDVSANLRENGTAEYPGNYTEILNY